jgi:hypothetical protein
MEGEELEVEVEELEDQSKIAPVMVEAEGVDTPLSSPSRSPDNARITQEEVLEVYGMLARSRG